MIAITLLFGMCALARASFDAGIPFHPVLDETRDALCVSGFDRPTIAIFDDTLSDLELANPAQYFCDEFAPSDFKGEVVVCSVGEASDVVLLSSQIGELSLPVDCSFVIDIVSGCPEKGGPFLSSDSGSGSGSGNGSGNGNGNGNGSGSGSDSSDDLAGSDSSDGEERKRQLFPPECKDRVSLSDCIGGCNPNDVFNGANCACVWDVLNDQSPQQDRMDFKRCPFVEVNGTMVQQQCCWNPPCTSYAQPRDCVNGSGGLLEFDPEIGDIVLVREGRCEFDDAQGCICNDPLVLTANPAEAPFDCDCPTDQDLFIETGVCPLRNDEEQLTAEKKASLALAQLIGKINVRNFVTQCKTDRLRLRTSRRKLFALFGRICDRLEKKYRNKGVINVVQSYENGCEFVFYKGRSGRARQLAEDEVPADQLDALVFNPDGELADSQQAAIDSDSSAPMIALGSFAALGATAALL